MSCLVWRQKRAIDYHKVLTVVPQRAIDYHKVLTVVPQTVEPIVRHAGQILLDYFQHDMDSFEKDDGSIATQADFASEQYLIASLQQILPGAGIYAEESGEREGNEYVWVIDPLDGTTNFARGFSYFAVSVALTYHGDPIFGVIYSPRLDEYFYAVKGGGAFVNGKSISVSQASITSKNVLVVAFPYVCEQSLLGLVNRIYQDPSRQFSVRKLGSGALGCAYVAAGRVDGLLLTHLSWWDIAAGMLLITEAGGCVSDFAGGIITEQYTSFIGAPSTLHGHLKDLLQSD